MNNKFVRVGVVVLIGVAILCSMYFLFKRLLRDRNAAMAYHEHPIRRADTSAQGTRTVKTYDSKNLQEARKKGDAPANTAAIQPNTMNDAVQRNLQTLDEINRINQMNQRLMEQQERIRRQNKN